MIQTFSTVSWGYPNRPYYNLQAFSPNWCPHSMDFLTSYTAFGLLPVNHNRFETQEPRIGPVDAHTDRGPQGSRRPGWLVKAWP
jgi:hypothetical protein